MTKADLVEEVASMTGLTKKDTAAVVDTFIDRIRAALKENKRIEIRGFGVFKNKERRRRTARNPRTGAPVEVPAGLVPTFKPSRKFKEIVAR
ncbi:hypothetical protein AMJ39_06050 [candidate division TA06 bacterium DG_24]|jgi:DNA-binding protein HU-beta|uniref:DNA-binding protein n=2 Tax=Bacteria division TA06 TaxID=1156500 RepID=A0A0S8GBP1_UNCT6|nr:MAG: hypothetical protein AMJ39_06050 [candidate division TA06 bacterium DG_24]KPK70415.1 MAG: hypothetical protein AMJ82_03415 [candidate division TA06 bacterium SM23_40]